MVVRNPELEKLKRRNFSAAGEKKVRSSVYNQEENLTRTRIISLFRNDICTNYYAISAAVTAPAWNCAATERRPHQYIYEEHSRTLATEQQPKQLNFTPRSHPSRTSSLVM